MTRPVPPPPESATPIVPPASSLTYAGYLHLDELLTLQQARSTPPEHDEMLFIIIHQTYELWFKLMLHELEKIKRDLSAGDLYGTLHTFERCRTIMKTLVGQLDILETMTPMSFASFRDRLETSSGFQSTQFREFEFVLGYRREKMLEYLPESEAEAVGRAREQLKQRSVVDHFYDFLGANGVTIPDELRDRDLAESNQPSEAVQQGLLELYKTRPDITILLELMTDFDEGLQEWRYRHVKMVERTIGGKRGTGGSPGVAFLKRSLFKPVFPDLWEIRHEL